MQVIFALALAACIGMTYFTDNMAVITLVIIINSIFALFVLKNEDLAYPSTFLLVTGIVVGLVGMCLAIILGNYYLIVLALPWSGLVVSSFILMFKEDRSEW
jgi:hypothetical protein